MTIRFVGCHSVYFCSLAPKFSFIVLFLSSGWENTSNMEAPLLFTSFQLPIKVHGFASHKTVIF